MEFELICNFRPCRQRISGHAWVTSCSHIFCDRDGEREFNKKLGCPACDTDLPGKFDIFRINMNPTEQFKSMILAGQKPETVLDVCSRAMAFWNYQTLQEKLYQEWVCKKLREQAATCEQRFEELVAKLQSEIKAMKSRLCTVSEELTTVVKRYEILAEKYNEKIRENTRLKNTNQALLKSGSDTPGVIGMHFEPHPQSTVTTHRTPLASVNTDNLSTLFEHFEHPAPPFTVKQGSRSTGRESLNSSNIQFLYQINPASGGLPQRSISGGNCRT